MTKRADLIRQHIPSLKDEDEDEIFSKVPGLTRYDRLGTPDTDVADLAIRTCGCGIRIDGFYEYTDHLIAVFEEAGL